MSDYHEGLEEGIKIGKAEAQLLREAIEMARRCIDADDVIGAHGILVAALEGRKKE